MKIIIFCFSLFCLTTVYANEVCNSNVSIWQKKNFNIGIFDENLYVDPNFVANHIQSFGYNLIGQHAYLYKNDVAIYISIDENLNNVDIKYFTWEKDNYGNIPPSFGDKALVFDRRSIYAKDLATAVTESLLNLKPCEEILKLF